MNQVRRETSSAIQVSSRMFFKLDSGEVVRSVGLIRTEFSKLRNLLRSDVALLSNQEARACVTSKYI